MLILKDVLIILFCIMVIAKGATWLVDSSVRMAKRLGISELIIGLTIVALGTSAPEFGVTILAAAKGMGDISVGNIVGSNIFNLGFILGGTAIIHSLKTNITNIRRDGTFLLAGTILLTIMLWDLSLSPVEGIILFTLLIAYLCYLYMKKNALETKDHRAHFNRLDPLLFLIGLGLVLAGSHFLVNSAVDLAKMIGISNWVIGVTIVAAGTSAPEFATSVVAALKGHHEISVGNLIGSDIFNMYGVLGLAAILRGLKVEIGARSNLIVLIIMVIVVMIFMRTGWRISRKEGVALVIIGLLRWIFSFCKIM
ncbi:calcium/sodium antiporter [bacterium]|nr:calcium/sodium antiporter [bacterium]